jgi:DNA-directed RNA polymerase subunit F
MEFSPNQSAGNPSAGNRKPFKMEMVGYLSNFEVYKYFSEIKESSSRNEERASALKYNKHLSTIVYEALQYFKKTACTVQTEEGIAEFVRRIQPFGLTKLEQLSLINTRPSLPVDIQALIEESEERLTEDQVDEIIQIVEECLPPVDPPGQNPEPE